jgi:2'-phosphotransferase
MPQTALDKHMAKCPDKGSGGKSGKGKGGGEWSRVPVQTSFSSKGKKSGKGKEESALSKQLCQLLRHSGRSKGLDIRPNGYVRLHDIFKLSTVAKLSPTVEAVRELVRDSDKQRFQLDEEAPDGPLIRATQGHSMVGISMDALCGDRIFELRPGEVCCHGTYEQHLDSILQLGLLAGGRQNVHFSVGNPGETVTSGMRQNCEIAVYVDLPRAARDGVPFYRSQNNVLLSDGINGAVPPQYIERIVHIKQKTQIYPPPNFPLPRADPVEEAGQSWLTSEHYDPYGGGNGW